VTHNEQALLFNCATGLKISRCRRSIARIDRHEPIDFAAL